MNHQAGQPNWRSGVMASPLWTTFGALALLLLVGGGAIPELGIAIYLGLVLTLMLSLIVLGFILG